MGNQQQKGIAVAVIKDPKYTVYHEKDYNMFFQDPDHIMCSLYDNFDEFIQKQSLKNLHHIIIIQEHKQFISKHTKVQQQNSTLAQYMRPIDNLITGRNQAQIRTRDKIINYIKKYSLQNINLYIYVKQFKSFIIPEYQVPYVTLVSTTSQMIISHIINETTQKMASVKFKGLVKDLYRKKLVVIISRYWQQKDKKNKKTNNKITQQKQESQQAKQKSAQISQVLKRMQQNFKSQQNNFEFVIVSSIQQLSDKLKSMYFEFMICVDQQDLLQIVEFKKKMPIQSKLIYYGTKKDLGQQQSKDNKIDQLIVQRKKKQIWWISNDLQNEISPVMKKWWNAKTQSSTNTKMAKNVIILVTKCQNIIQKKYIKQQISNKITTKGITINIQHKIQNIFKRLRNDLYTIVIIFDSTFQQFQQTKKIIMSKIKGEPRVQLSLVEMKKQSTEVKKNFKQLLDKRIEECSNKKYFQFKHEISPIQTINCLNLTTDQHQYFSYKMGLQVNVIQPQYTNEKSNQLSSEKKQKKLYKILQNYFPKIVTKRVTQNGSTIQSNKQSTAQQLAFELWSTFENFYIVCSFDDYLRYLFPYFMLAHFYDKKHNVFQLPSKQHFEQIMNYLNRIKVVIYCEVEYDENDRQNKIGLKQLLRIHSNPAQAQKYIKKAIYEFLQIPYQGETHNTNNNDLLAALVSPQKKPQKQQKKKQPTKQQLQHQQQKQHQRQQQQFSLKKLFQHIESVINKPLLSYDLKNQLLLNLIGNESKTQLFFPNIDFVHFKLSDIESHIKLCKYNQLSFSFFPKGSLKDFHIANKQVENITSARSFIMDASFGANSDQLKKIFQKNIQVTSTHRMQFVKPKVIIQEKKFQNFIKKYSGMWKLPFEVMQNNTLRPQYWEFSQQALQSLKQGIIRAFKRSKNYELLKVSPPDFKQFYIDRIQSCKNLLDLQIAAIYIYSLPHGMSEIVASIFQQNARSTLSLQIFIEFLFVLFLNFFSFHSRKLQKVETVIYGDQNQMKNFYEYLKQDEIIFNKNMLHLMDNENVTENERNHCIIIEYENVPYMKQSSLSAMLEVEELSFYKQSAEYLLAPFTKLRLKKKLIVSGRYQMYFEVVHDHESNLFLKSFFQLNNIKDIGIFQALDQEHFRWQRNNADSEQKMLENDDNEQNVTSRQNTKMQKHHQNEKEIINNEQKHLTYQMKKQRKKTRLQKNMQKSKPEQKQQFTSLYRQAQQIGLREQKQSVQFSIRLNISFMKMLESIYKNNLFTAEKYLQLLYTRSESEWKINQGEKKKFQLVKQLTQLKKLSIYQAMIYAKRHQFNKAINQLDMLLQFMRLQKTEDKGDWIKIKVIELKQEILRVRNQRHTLIYLIENNQQNEQREHAKKQQQGGDKLIQFNSLLKLQQNINNNKQQQQKLEQKQKQKQGRVRNKKLRKQKWKVNASVQNQTFILTNITKEKDQTNKQNQHFIQEQKKWVFDIYCRKLFQTKQRQLNSKSKLPSYNQLISTANIKQPPIDNKNKDKKNNKQFEQNLLKTSLNKSIIGRFFKEMQLKQFDGLKLMNVFLLFRDKICQLDSNSRVQQGYNINEQVDDMRGRVSLIAVHYMLQKFQHYVGIKLLEFRNYVQQNDSRQSNEIKQLGFVYYLRQAIKIDSLSNYHQQLLKEHEFHLQHTLKQGSTDRNNNEKTDRSRNEYNNTQNRTNNNNKNDTSSQIKNMSWIDRELILMNGGQARQKWSVFQFQNKTIVVNANRKWKQKIENKNSKIFYRAQNELLINQKANRQSQKNNNQK